MKPRDEQLDVNPLQVAQSIAIGFNEKVFGLGAAIDVENLGALAIERVGSVSVWF